MDSWRRRKGGTYGQEVQRTRSWNRKPPLTGIWQPTVPSWEKMFCKKVGLISWQKILESKKIMHLFDKVVNWNDSAGEEAFNNAKSRFHANYRGLPWDTPLPDPDTYIDEIDWDSITDPKLLDDLEDEAALPYSEDHVVIFGDSLVPEQQGFSSSGWGEIEEPKVAPTNVFPDDDNNNNAWAQNWNWNQNYGYWDANGWGQNGNYNMWNPNQWGYGWNGSWSWDQNCGTWYVSNGNNEARHKPAKFQGYDQQQRSHGWRNGKNKKKGDFVNQGQMTTGPQLGVGTS